MKEKYRLRDRTLRVMTEDGAFRVSVLKATDMVNHARTRHQTNPAGSVILGEMLMGVLLAASNLKAEERISIRLEVNGEIKSALVEANMAGEVRGYLGNPNPIPQGNTPEENIKNAIGIGLMHVTRTLYNQARPVHSTVMLEHSNIAKDLTHYFAVSEQIPASIRLDIRFNPDFSIRHAMGFMVQAMPGADEEAIIEIENNIIDLPHPSEIIDNGGYLDEIMTSLLKGRNYQELSRTPVDFFCRCSKEKFLSSLLLLNPDELNSLNNEQEELRCHYCNEKYMISHEEIQELMHERK